MVLFSLDDIYIKMYVYVFQILNQTFIINELDYEWFQFIINENKYEKRYFEQ
jgi:hypothetical protein